MNVRDFRPLLTDFAATLDAGKAPAAGLALRTLCDMFSGSETKTVAAFAKVAAGTELAAQQGNGFSLAHIGPVLEHFRSLLIRIGAKKALIGDLEVILGLMKGREGVAVDAFVLAVRHHVASASKPKNTTKPKSKKEAAPVDLNLVGDYVRRLESALGDDAKFSALLEELRADKRVQKPEAVAIAARFIGPTPASTSRPKALERVHQRHKKLMTFKAIPGRSAA